MISQTTNAIITCNSHSSAYFFYLLLRKLWLFNRSTGEAGFLAKGWSRIAMRWCSSALILFTFLLPASPASSLLPFLSHVDAARAAWGETIKKRLICSLLGQLCSLAVPPFFDPLSPILGTSAILPLCVVSRCSSAVDFFFIVLFLSCVQGHRRTLWVSSWPEFSFISKINCFSIKPPSNNRSSCTVCCWSKLRPLLNWFCRSCWNIWFSRSEGFNKTEFCDHDSWTLSP